MSEIGNTPARRRAQRRWAAGRAGLLRRMERAGGRQPSVAGIRVSDAFALVLFGVFALALFAALVLGTTVYQGIAADTDDARQLRQGTSLLANTLRSHDAADAVSAAEGPEGPALVLTEHLETGDFATYLYLQDGWVKQEYRPAGASLATEGAQDVVSSDTFSFEILDGAVRISTDQGETFVSLRADGAVADADAGAGAGSDEAASSSGTGEAAADAGSYAASADAADGEGGGQDA